MLYLDSSALVKLYIQEKGTESLKARLVTEDALFSSTLTYAEIHAALATRMREGAFNRLTFGRAARKFASDWRNAITSIALDTNVLAQVKQLVFPFALRGGDAVHLATAIWLRDRQRRQAAADSLSLDFAASDRHLLQAAEQIQFKVFDPAGRP